MGVLNESPLSEVFVTRGPLIYNSAAYVLKRGSANDIALKANPYRTGGCVSALDTSSRDSANQ